MTRTLSFIASLTLLTALGATAGAQTDPADLAARCVGAMHQASAEGAEDIKAITARTTAEVRRLAASGADDDRIIAAGHSGISGVGQAADAAHRTIRALRHDCIAALQRMDAPRRLIARVAYAARAAHADVSSLADRSNAAINAAVRDALR